MLKLQFNKKSFRKTDNVVVNRNQAVNAAYCLVLGLEHDVAFGLDNLPYPEQQYLLGRVMAIKEQLLEGK
ncbi:hypothetical protein [Virgibacillus sp. Bac330]|uniref:hypothetical protein n=1 Tax=Virgibacillus sp. Bac330 TaxID=2419841 RepID=UPI000EF4D79C|nr:hypothetical protein [Virgibacillus sp. Bac330]